MSELLTRVIEAAKKFINIIKEAKEKK